MASTVTWRKVIDCIDGEGFQRRCMLWAIAENITVSDVVQYDY
jgi:hypothetical protein